MTRTQTQARCGPMKALVFLVLGIALVDGLNPSTIAPALVLAVRRRGVLLVSLFTLGVFVPSLAAIVRSSAALVTQLELVALFNLAFILPLLAILGVRLLAGPRSERLLQLTRGALDRYVGVVLPCAVALLAAVLVILGVVGLVRA